MKTVFASLAIMSLLSGCYYAAERGFDPFPRGHGGPEARAEDDCLSLNGSWQMGGSGTMLCNIATPDGGKPCRDTSECKGICLAASGDEEGSRAVGACSSTFTPLGGCRSHVHRGYVMPSVCVD